MNYEQNFLSHYRRLNEAQKEAVDTIEGPVMVIAGPGTGKTQVLTLRIANILRQTDTSPDSILALTFTTSGVYSMRRRLVEIIGEAGYRVNITTFHSFCNDLIQDFPEEFPEIIGSTAATEVDQIRIMSDVISRLSLSLLKPFGDTFYYVRPALSEISRLKRENILPADLSQIVATGQESFANIPDLYYESGAHQGKMKGKYKDQEKMIARHAELAQIYEEYEKELRLHKLYDFEDMIVSAIQRLGSNEDLLLQLQEEYQYVLADEHQDANGSQNRLLELLTNFHDNPNLFIVGDEKQAIFQFQGASLDNFDYFARLYPEAKQINLSHNYRSSQIILDSALSLISNSGLVNQESLVRLAAGRSLPDLPINRYEFTKSEFEYRFIASDIKDKIASGVVPSEIAILYRNNRDALELVPWLEKAGLSVTVESDDNVLDDPDLRKLVLLIQASAYYGDESLLIKVLHLDIWQLDPLDVYKVIKYASQYRKHLIDVIKDPDDGLSLSNIDRLQEVVSLLAKWHQAGHNKNLLQVIENIIEKSNFLNHLLTLPSASVKVEKLRTFFDQIKSLVAGQRDFNLVGLVEYLDLMETQGLAMKSHHHGSGGIRLMTAHKSKGMEFEYVYIVKVRDGHWGNKRSRSLFKVPIRGFELVGQNTLEDERRLFYVAITRAKQEVNISLSTSGEEGKHYLPSVFLEEIKPEFVSVVNTVPIEESLIGRPAESFVSSPESQPASLADKEFVRDILHKQGLSVSGLNNYLECPWKYFFLNLLRIPRAKSKHAMYGTAVHDALSQFFDQYQKTEVSKDDLLNFFTKALGQQSLSQADLVESMERGQVSLAGYYDTYHGQWPRQVLTEFKIKGVEVMPGIPLTGVLDKIEILDSSGSVNVVDYKTGSPKSRNHIEGKTKGSTGNFHRQLVFYKLLLDRYDEGRYRMESGQIDFVEPDAKSGKYKKESFEISYDQVAELTEQIKQSIDEILNLSFWSNYCSEPACEYCGMRRVMDREVNSN